MTRCQEGKHKIVGKAVYVRGKWWCEEHAASRNLAAEQKKVTAMPKGGLVYPVAPR